MGLNGPVRTDSAVQFPFGVAVCGPVTSAAEFNKNAAPSAARVQARDKDTGLPLWQVDVMDLDPDARERTFRVKVVSAVQPVPPDAIAGTPLRPVYLENLQILAWLPKEEQKNPKIQYSAKCTGLLPPKKATATGSGSGSADAKAA